MSKYLLRQGLFLPLAAMLLPVLVGFFVPGYSSVSQHLSELEPRGGFEGATTQISAAVSGVSIALFGLGAFVYSRAFRFTAFASGLFGIAMISNGVFIMGSPLHGLYGTAMVSALVPAFFAAESRDANVTVANAWHLAAALLTLAYMWLLMSDLDPAAYRGLTQRVAILVTFGWFSLASLTLLRNATSRSKEFGQLSPAPARA
jgi:hypothetical protein